LDLRRKNKMKLLVRQVCVEGHLLKKTHHSLTAKEREDGKQEVVMFLNDRSARVRIVGESEKFMG